MFDQTATINAVARGFVVGLRVALVTFAIGQMAAKILRGILSLCVPPGQLRKPENKSKRKGLWRVHAPIKG